MKTLITLLFLTFTFVGCNITSSSNSENYIEKTSPYFSYHKGFYYYESKNGMAYRHHLPFDGEHEKLYHLKISKTKTGYELISAKKLEIQYPHEYSW